MTKLFATMIAIMFFIIPVLAMVLLIQFLRKKPIKKLGLSILVCIGLIIPLTILGVLTDPATWCDHEYEIVEEVAPTCTEEGRVVKHCPLCEGDDTEYIDAIGHSMKEASRIEPTYDNEGKVIKKCERCDFEETELIDKLERPVTTTKPTDAPKKETTKPTTKPTTTIETEPPVTTEPSTTEKETIEKLPTLTYIEDVDYEEIYKAYKVNKLKAEDVYSGNRYRVTATVNGMSTGGLFNITGGATLTMLIKIDNTHVFFLAEFEREQEEALKTIEVGDTITFEGKCASDEMWVECELIK